MNMPWKRIRAAAFSVLCAAALICPARTAYAPGMATRLEGAFAPEESVTDNNALFYEYLLRRGGVADHVSLLSDARSTLNETDRKFYDQLKAMITEVADGTRTSSVFDLTYENFKTTWTAAELGVSSIVADNAITQEAEDALFQRMEACFVTSPVAVINALLADCPYELYWFDKTAEQSFSVENSFGAENDGTGWVMTTDATLTYRVTFPVSQNYGSGTTVDRTLHKGIDQIVSKATAIVDRYKDASDYAKLLTYSTEICKLTDYDDNAAKSGAVSGGDPWQLINVFDDDVTTNVVCEGYSKAFKYLCDLSAFNSPNVECYLATGALGAAGSATWKEHMWNIVTMSNGKRYLVDVTNSDANRRPDYLLLKGGVPNSQNPSQYAFYNNSFVFVYDSEAVGLWGSELLTLDTADYDQMTPDPTPVNAPTVENFSYAFSNSRAGFGYPSGYKIPYARYVTIFGNSVMAKSLYKSSKAWGGNCYGLSTTAGMFFQKDNQVNVSAFNADAAAPLNLQLTDANGAWNMTVQDFIECMQVSQNALDIQNAYRSRTNQLQDLCDAVAASERDGQNAVVIAVFGPQGGHAILGYKIENISDTQSRLYVYDSNYPKNAERYITLDKDASGNYVGWYYPLNDAYDWGSAFPQCWISYITYADYYQIWKNREQKGAVNLAVLTVNDDARLYDAKGAHIASIRNGELETERDDMFLLVNVGLTEDGMSSETEVVSVWLPPDLYTVERVSAVSGGDPFEASMTHMDQSASVSTTAASVLLAVDDGSQLNMATIPDGQEGESYDITLTSTLDSSENEELHLTGTVMSTALTFMQVNGITHYSGVSFDDTITTSLTIDGQEYHELEPLTNAAPVMSFVSDGGTGYMLPKVAEDNDNAVVMPDCEFGPPEGMKFLCWSVNGTEYQPGERYELTENAAAVAVWRSPDGEHENRNECEIYAVTPDGPNVTVEFMNRSGDGVTLMVAAYAENGQFLRAAMESLRVDAGKVTFSVTLQLDAADAKTVKAFLLDGETQKPLFVKEAGKQST